MAIKNLKAADPTTAKTEPQGKMPAQETGVGKMKLAGTTPVNDPPSPGAGRTTSDPIPSGGAMKLSQISARPNNPPHASAHRRK